MAFRAGARAAVEGEGKFGQLVDGFEKDDGAEVAIQNGSGGQTRERAQFLAEA